ncbi:MAG TPA: MFS transporter [Gaiellaceae bacterium]|nr:MFS transporter [Gaiellaceae bacterium]
MRTSRSRGCARRSRRRTAPSSWTAPRLSGPSRSDSRRALGLLALALVLSMSTWFSASAVLPQLRDEWGIGNTAGAWLTIAVQLGFVAGALGSSVVNLADVRSARAVIVAGSLGAAGANVGLLAVSSAAGAIPLRFLTGVFLAGVYPPALKLMSTWFVRGRGTALGILVGALSVGSAAPHLVNGLGGLDWQLVVAVTSALTAAGALVVLAGVHEGPFPFPRAVFDPRQAGLVFRNRGVRLASLGYFGHMWELYAMWAWFGVFAAERLYADRADAAVATFAVIAAGGIGCIAGGLAGDRFGRPETTAACMVASGLCALSIGLVPHGLALAVGLVWGFTVVADSAQFSTLVTEHADQAYVGTALTLQLAVGFTLTVTTIWLLPTLVDGVGWDYAFAFLAAGPALGVAAMLRLRGV